MKQSILIEGQQTEAGMVLAFTVQASPSTVLRAATLLLETIARDDCTEEYWPHIQSALNCLSLTGQKHVELTEAQVEELLEKVQ